MGISSKLTGLVVYVVIFIACISAVFLGGWAYQKLSNKTGVSTHQTLNTAVPSATDSTKNALYIGHPMTDKGGNELNNHAFVIFKSTGKITERDVNDNNGNFEAKLWLVEGNIPGGTNFLVVAQALSAKDLSNNIFGGSIKDAMYKLGMSNSYDGKGVMDLKSLEKIFSAGSAWQAKFLLDPKEISDPIYFLPGSPYNEMYSTLLNSEVINITDLRNAFDRQFVGVNQALIIFPYVLSPFQKSQ